MTTTPTSIQQDITDAEAQYTNFDQNVKFADNVGLTEKNNMWRSSTGDPFTQMMMWLNNILISGDGASTDTNRYSQINGSLLDKQQDLISETANGMNFLAKYREAITDLQNTYSNASTTDDPTGADLTRIQADLSILASTKDPNNNLNFGYTDPKTGVFTPVIDPGSQTQISQTILGADDKSDNSGLEYTFSQIQNGPWNDDLHTFLEASTSKDDTSNAAAMAQQITQALPTITQATGLVSQTLQEQFGFIKADMQQYLALWQTIMKSLTTVFTTFIGNEKSGTT